MQIIARIGPTLNPKPYVRLFESLGFGSCRNHDCEPDELLSFADTLCVRDANNPETVFPESMDVSNHVNRAGNR